MERGLFTDFAYAECWNTAAPYQPTAPAGWIRSDPERMVLVHRLVPLRPGLMDQLVLEGRATQAVGDLLDLADELGLPADNCGAVLPSVALVELRADER